MDLSTELSAAKKKKSDHRHLKGVAVSWRESNNAPQCEAAFTQNLAPWQRESHQIRITEPTVWPQAVWFAVFVFTLDR